MYYRWILLLCVSSVSMTAIFAAGPAAGESLAAMAERAARLEAGGKSSSKLSWQVHDRLKYLAARLQEGDSSETWDEVRAGLSCRHDSGYQLLRAAICAGEAEIAHLMMSREKPKKGALDDRSIWRCVAEHPSALIARALRETGSPEDWPPRAADLVVKHQAYELFTEQSSKAVELAILGHRDQLAMALAVEMRTGFEPERTLLRVAKDGDAASLEILAGLPRSYWTSFSVLSQALAEVVCQGDAAKVRILAPLLAGNEASGGFEAAGRCRQPEMVEVLLDGGLVPAGGELRTWNRFESLPPGLVRRLTQHLGPDQLVWVLLNPGTRNRLPELTEAVARQEAERHLGSTGNLEYRLLALGFNRPRTPSSNTRSRPPFDLEEKDEGGNTGVALAVSGEKAGLFDLYHRAGANLDTTNWAGDGLLHLAAGRGSLDLMEKLLAAGIQRKANKKGQMPGDILWRTGDNFGNLRLNFRAPTLQRLADFLGCEAEDAARTFKLECQQNEQFSRPSGQFTLTIEGRRLNLLQRLKAAIGGRSGQAPQLEQKTVGDRAIATLAGSRDGYAVEIRATGPLLLSDEVRSLRDWGFADAFHPKDAPGTTSPQVKTLRVALLLGLLGLLFFILNLVRSRRS